MKGIEVVNQLLDAIEGGDMVLAKSYLTADFVFAGPTPMPLTGEEWLDLHSRLCLAFPNWAFSRSGFKVSEDTVNFTVEVKGTHLGVLDLPHAGVVKMLPTDKDIKLPVEQVSIRVCDNHVQSFVVKEEKGGGLAGILDQLGLTSDSKNVA